MQSRKSAPCLALLAAAAIVTLPGGALRAQAATQPSGDVDLTLETMVEFALNNSYRVRHLNINVERTRLNLQASRARLKSRVDLDFTIPRINVISETRWNSDLQRNVIERENSRRVAAELSVRQPVVLFGFPTNGYLSLNNTMYRLTQHESDSRDIRYYNRYFVRYTQPLFQANSLRNDLEQAEMSVEEEELDYQSDIVDIIDNTADDYYDLFEIAYEQQIRESYVANLERALALAQGAVATDPDRAIDVDQIRVELANAREEVSSLESRWRLETSSIKTEFNIPQAATISIDPVIELSRVAIDPQVATRYAMEFTPRMRKLDLSYRRQEIRLDETKGRGGFEMDVSLSYGREMQDEIFGQIWDEPENTYTVDVAGSLPIWDWGERKARIEASRLNVDQSQLRIEETTADIENDIQNEVRNVAEYENRAFNMQANLELSQGITQTSITRYADGAISALDLITGMRRELDTANNFLDAYLGWRNALQRMQEMTYYDFEYGMRVMNRFGITLGATTPRP